MWASDLRALSLGVHLFLIFVICCLKVSPVSYGCGCMWDRNVVHGELRCVAVFWVMAGKDSSYGFGWGYFKSVCSEPVVKCVKVGLK